MSIHLPKSLVATFLATVAGAAAAGDSHLAALDAIKQVGSISVAVVGALNLSKLLFGMISNWSTKQVRAAVEKEMEPMKKAIDGLACMKSKGLFCDVSGELERNRDA